MTDLERTHIIQLPHDTFDECGLSFAVLTHKSHFLSAANGECHVMEHGMRAEILAQVLHDQRKITASRCRRETEVQPTCIFQIDLKSFEFFELFDTTLYLYRFGRFVPETLYKLLCILDHLLLVQIRPDLLFVPFLT